MATVGDDMNGVQGFLDDAQVLGCVAIPVGKYLAR